MRSVDSLVLPADRPARDAMQLLDDSQAGIVLVVGPDGTLEGTVTDGDLRRAVLSGTDLSRPVAEIMCARPVTAHETTPEQSVIELLRVHRISQVPVVDDGHRPIGLFHLNDTVVPVRSFAAAVLLPARRTRRDGTGIERLVALTEMLRTAGIKSIHVAGDEELRQRINDPGVLVEAAPLRTVLDQPQEGPIVVIDEAIDDDLDLPLERLFDYHFQHGVAATVGVVEHLVTAETTVATAGPWVTGLLSDSVFPVLTPAGVYVLEPDVVRAVAMQGADDLAGVIEGLVASVRPVVAFPLGQRWVYV